MERSSSVWHTPVRPPAASTSSRARVLTVATMVVAVASLLTAISIDALSGSVVPHERVAVDLDPSRVPLGFEPNRGQVDERVLYLSRGDRSTVFMMRRGILLGLAGADGRQPVLRDELAAGALPDAPPYSMVGVRFIGASATARATGHGLLDGVSNYLWSADASGWITDVPHYSSVAYRDLYEGVDLEFYGAPGGDLEFDFVLEPGVDPGTIGLRYAGVRSLTLDASGALVLHLPTGSLRQPLPAIYQWVDGARREVQGSYVLHKPNAVGFLVGRYDRRFPLVIDPVISYSTYLGGSGDEFPIWTDIDAAGNFYVTGITFSPDLPTTPGAFQPSAGGGADAFVTKLDPTGIHLVYSTYLGGAFFDLAIGLDVDASGSVVVTGGTSSRKFPTTSGALQDHYAGGDLDTFVTKLSPSGSSLVFSTLLGGNSFDLGFIVFYDAAGNVYVEGETGSKTFPTTPDSFQPAYGGGPADGFVTKLDPTGSSLIYSTFVGGSGYDGAHDGVLDAVGNFYIDGPTGSVDFPTTTGAFQPSFGGGSTDAFVAKVNGTGSALTYSSYLGGSGDEDVLDMTIDGVGNAFVPGPTSSTDFPTTPGAFQTAFGGGELDGYLVKVNTAGSALVYSSYLGGSGFDLAGAVRVDRGGNAHIPGITGSTDFPITRDAFQPTYGGGPTDAFVLSLNKSGSKVLFSSFIGGSGEDGSAGAGAWLDASGNFYIPGSTDSTDFPTTPGAFATQNAGGIDVFLLKLALGRNASAAPVIGQTSDRTATGAASWSGRSAWGMRRASLAW